ncbi:MAG TPA: hypothetical protein VD978_17680 [Azospirillum sp.]|nr:hypothetical protein [Azospirillum sp.]
MTNPSRPITAARATANQRTADAWPALSQVPEWPRLTRSEVRQIVLDILG